MEDGSLIRDFTILIGSSGISGLVFHVLGLPLLLGYILSGIVIGPYSFFSSYIQNYEVIHQIGELGVIFLMFYVGLEFDLNKLRKSIGPSFIAVVLQTVCMMFVGIMVSRMLGWSGLNGLFLGALMSISSTMVSIPIMNGQNQSNTHAGQLAMGILVLEDMVAILLLVILSGVALNGRLDWLAVGRVSFFVGVFVVVVFVLGRFLGARVANILKRISSVELLAVVSTGFVLFFCEIANKAHFSIELGAFLAGSVLSRSAIAHSVERVTESLRNVFCAMFFVTVGLKIDPVQLMANWQAIFIVGLIVTIAKIFVCSFGLCASGEKPETAFYASVFKSQIGEFSFIIAALGNSLGVVSPNLMSLAAGVSVCTIVYSSILSKHVEFIYQKLKKVAPKSLVNFGDFYNNLLHVARIKLEKNTLFKESRIYLGRLLWYGLLMVGLMVLSAYGSYWIQVKPIIFIGQYQNLAIMVLWGAIAFVIMPIFVGIVKNINEIVNLVISEIFRQEGESSIPENNTIKLVRHVIFSVTLLLFGILFISVSSSYLPSGYSLTAFLVLSFVQILFFWRRLIQSNNRFENSFRKTFIAEVQEKDEEYRNELLQKLKGEYPWEVQIKDYILPKKSIYIGKRIAETGLREASGVTIVAISRNGYTSYSPNPDTVLFPEDHMLLLGEGQQIEQAILLLKQESGATAEKVHLQFAIEHYCISGKSPFRGKMISETNLRSHFGVNIVGIQRQGEKILTPKPSTILEKDDILILTGFPKSIEKLKESELTAVS